jgi:hypothetical protein
MGRVIFTLLPVTSTTASSPVDEGPVDRMKNLSAALSRKAGKPAVQVSVRSVSVNRSDALAFVNESACEPSRTSLYGYASADAEDDLAGCPAGRIAGRLLRRPRGGS